MVNYSSLYKIIQGRIDMALREAEKRFDDSKAITQMSKAELEPYRIVENHCGLYLVPKSDKGISIEDVFPIEKLGKSYIGARIHMTKSGYEIIIKVTDI